jgi:hypothetical protein
MVEFTLVLMPLLLLLFGIIELGLVMFDKVTVVHDARVAARYAAVNDPQGNTLLDDAPAGSALSFSCPNGKGIGEKIIAHVEYEHTFITPLIGDLFGGSMNLSSNATMMIEAPPDSFC